MIRSQRQLVQTLNFNDNQLRQYIVLKKGYRLIKRPKKGGGTRLCYEPPEELKKIHRRIKKLLQTTRVSSCAYGGVKGRGRHDIALIHRKGYWFITWDIKSFFESVNEGKIYSALLSIGFSQKYASLFAELLSYRKKLPTGSPTASILADIILNSLDEKIRKLLPSGASYTRLVDNFIVSLPEGITKSSRQDLMEQFQKATNQVGYTLKDKVECCDKSHANDVLGFSLVKKINVKKPWYRQFRSDMDKLEKGISKPTANRKRSIEGKLVSLKDSTKGHKHQGRYNSLLAIFNQVKWEKDIKGD